MVFTLGKPNHHQHMFDNELDDGPSKADAIKSLLFNPVMLLRVIYKRMLKPAGRLLVSGSPRSAQFSLI